MKRDRRRMPRPAIVFHFAVLLHGTIRLCSRPPNEHPLKATYRASLGLEPIYSDTLFNAGRFISRPGFDIPYQLLRGHFLFR